MQTRRIIRLAVAAMLAASALALAACSGSESDKAGGADEAEPLVLTLANPYDSGPPAQLESWAEEVSRLSGGTLAIEFENGWRLDEPLYEAGTLEDVKAGKVDLAWVGSRVFDTVGVTSFQALQAPLLIDSYDLEGKVFEERIPERMLEGVTELDLVGMGVLPGPMRKVLGVSKPFVRPADFESQVVGLQDSAVADASLRALGTMPRAVPSGAKLDGLDAYEQQLGSIAGNSYDANAEYVTSNVNLWPRPSVLVMGSEAFESLTDEQRSALRAAAATAVPEALAAEREGDAEAADILCRRGMTFATASESDLAELRAALEPVYADLRSDPKTKSYIDAITSLKREITASAEAPACTSTEPPPPAAAPSILDGTYETTLTMADWLKGSDEEALDFDGPGVYTLTFAAGELTMFTPDGEIGFPASYTVYRDQFEARASDGYTITARWSLKGETLRFTDIDVPGKRDASADTVYWASHPWVKTD